MSALGHKRTLKRVRLMSALPPKADIAGHDQDVRFVPIADIVLLYSTTWSVHCDHGGMRNLK
jgi:hypothetical protein